jgi:UDP-N-acetylglucosamine 1-carboxyvinyltransferase
VQAQLTALLATVDGISLITDKVFPDRFMHISELARMGARIRREGASAIVTGPTRLSGASVMASDLRASAALVLAALAADGPSVVRRIYHLDRGYERFEAKLCALGADVRRVEDIAANVPPELLEVSSPPVEPKVSGPHWTGSVRRRLTPHG